MDDPSSFLFIIDFSIQAKENFLFEPTIDPIEISVQVACILLGLFFSALFSGSEVAFFSLSNQEDLLSEGDIEGTADRLIIRMLEQPRRLLATILIGNTFANTIASVLAAVVAGNLMAYYGLGEFLVYFIEVVVLTFMILILSEITPKIIAINNPLKATRRISRFIYVFFILFKPLSKIIASSTLSLEERLPKLTSKMTSEDIMTMAEVSEQEGSIKSDEREIIENVIEFGSTTVREIMTSRVDIVAISTGNSLDEVLSVIREEGLSRMPIYENDLDNILGVIHSKDVLPYINSDIERTTINWRTIARKALFIPSTKKLDDLLRDFQQEKTHIAIVVDEYGGTEGLITLDDILEEIVGDIADEYDEDEDKLYTKFKSGVYIFDARIDLDDMEDILNRELTSDDDQYETLGGLVYHLTERIPNVGERVYYQNLELTIHSVQNNRVRKLRVKVQDRPQSPREHHQTQQ
ncbi:hemolysin family protein [Fodinibius saliphilus]|uniref:hemolysin family protein n=1 Tax=Fodinibius saliphilus TaxID=1920650 RepID=UPI001109B754|nr:hemolysin family protein [Fodinibius saliphilus]